MTALSFDATKISTDPLKGAVNNKFQAASAITAPLGKAVYLDTDGKIALADADVTDVEARAVGVITAVSNQYGENALATDEWCTVTQYGPVYGFSGLAEGTYAWVGATAGELDDTAPTGGAYQYIVGQCHGDDVFFVNPGISAPESVS